MRKTSSLRKFAVAWTLMWGLAYIMTAFFAPWTSGIDTDATSLLYFFLGAFIIASVGLVNLAKMEIYISLGRLLLFIFGVIEVFGGIASWTGLALWNVPFPNKELFQVSMAFADLLSAVFMFYLAIDTT